MTPVECNLQAIRNAAVRFRAAIEATQFSDQEFNLSNFPKEFTWSENVASIQANGFRNGELGVVYFAPSSDPAWGLLGKVLLEVTTDLAEEDLARYANVFLDPFLQRLVFLLPEISALLESSREHPPRTAIPWSFLVASLGTFHRVRLHPKRKTPSYDRNSATDFSDSASPIPSGNRWFSTAHPRPGPPHEPGGGPEKGLNAGFARSWLARYFTLHAPRLTGEVRVSPPPGSLSN